MKINLAKQFYKVLKLHYYVQVFHNIQVLWGKVLNLMGKLFSFINFYKNFSNLNLFYSIVNSIF